MNILAKTLHRFSKWFLRRILTISKLRSWIAFELRQHYYEAFEVVVPLSHGLKWPVNFWESWASFGFIFFGGEYSRAFREMPTPARWIDLGCYAGHFSLYVAQLRGDQGLDDFGEALLIDADSRATLAVNKLISANQLESNWTFLRGAISRQSGRLRFAERSFMTSSLSTDALEHEGVVEVDVITAADILKAFPPPYDLIKIDIEGGEYDFLLGYSDVLEHTEYLLIEWHAWHPGGGGEAQVRTLVEGRGFNFVAEVLAPIEVQHRSASLNSGVLLFRRVR